MKLVGAFVLVWLAGIEPGLAANADWVSPLVGGQGGQNFSLYCNTHSYLVGVRIRAGDDVDAISPICGQLLAGNARGQISYYYKAGGNGGTEQDLVCPSQAPFVRQLYIQGQGIDTVLVGGISFRCGPIVGAIPTQIEGHNYFKVSTRYVSTWLTHDDKRTFVCPNANTAFSGLFGRAGAFLDALGVSCDKLAPTATPYAFQPAATEWNSAAAGGSGGAPFLTRCPGSTFLTGFNVRTGNDLDAIGPICAQAMRNGQRGKLIHQPQAGGSGGYLREMTCPTHIPFVRSVGWSWEGVDSQLLNSLYFLCGKIDGPVPAAVKDQNSFGFSLHVQKYSSFASNPTGGHQSIVCPDGMLFNGVHGRAGAMVDALGMICDNKQVALSSVGKKAPPPPVLAGRADERSHDMPDITPEPPVANATVTGEASRSREHTATVEQTAAPGTQAQPSQLIQGSRSALYEPAATRAQTSATQGHATVAPSTATFETARSTGAVRAATRRDSTAAAGTLLICRGLAGLNVGPSPYPSTVPLPSGQMAYMVYFGVDLAGTNERGEGLAPGNCGLIGRGWVPGDPPGVHFTVDATTQSPQLWMTSPDNYWAFTVEKRHGYFEATESVQRLNDDPAVAAAGDPATAPASPAIADRRDLTTLPIQGTQPINGTAVQKRTRPAP